MILYIAFNEYTYTSTSKYKKSKEPCFEREICQPLGFGLVGNSSGILSQDLGDMWRAAAAGNTADALESCKQMGRGMMDVSRGVAWVALCSGCCVLNVGDYRLCEQQIYSNSSSSSGCSASRPNSSPSRPNASPSSLEHGTGWSTR